MGIIHRNNNLLSMIRIQESLATYQNQATNH